MDLQASTAPHPRLPRPIHPEPELLLLAAVQRRDRNDSRRLAQRLVHRRGLEALAHFLNHNLPSSGGEESSDWLRELMGSTAELPAPTLTAHPVDPQPQQQRELERQIAADVDAAIAAMLATFPSEQLAQLPAREAFAALEQLDPDDLGSPQSAALEGSALPAELLVDPDFLGLAGAPLPALSQPPAASREEWATAPSAPLSFRIEPRAAQSGEQGAGDPAFPSAPVDAPESQDRPMTALADEPEAQQWPGSLRERLRRRLPRAARALKDAMAAGAWRGSWWQAADGSEAEAQSQAPTVAEALSGGVEAMPRLMPEGDSRHLETIAEGPAAAELVLQPSVAAAWVHPEPSQPGSASLRLMQRLSERREHATEEEAASPAPRPSSLADLRAWLPETRLPHAS